MNLKQRLLKSKLSDKALKMHSSEKSYKRMDTIDFITTLIMVIIAVFAFRAFIFEPVQVSGGSMTNTLQEGERMFVEKFSYWFSTPNRGDIIICHYPETYWKSNPDRTATDTYVKRVIGLPGETIWIDNGITYVKSAEKGAEFVALDEPYIKEEWTKNADGIKITIPNDCVFVMGDNRNYSADSRSLNVGPIKLSQIVGRVHGVIYPINNIREIDEVNYAQ